MTDSHSSGATDPERMQCMEVWGGNQAVNRHVQTAGLDLWIYSQPYGAAVGGGDVHYLSSCASGRITRLLLADISGHGETASRLAIELRDLMRQNVNYVKQTRFVRAMNAQFTASAKQGRFATALVSTFFAPMRRFSWCNAGHPPPLWYCRSTGEWTELSTVPSESLSDLPLGVVGDSQYTQHAIRLEKGDRVLSFSDAVTESVDCDGEQLGQNGVLKLLQQADATNAADIIPTVIDRITEMSPTNLAQDDATLMLCEATGTSASLKNSLMAPLRFVGSVADRTELGFAD